MIKKTLILVSLLFSVQFMFGQYVFLKNYTGIDIGGGLRTIGIDAPGVTFNIERGVVQIARVGAIAVGARANVIFPKESDIEPSITLRTTYHIGLFRTKIVDLYTGVGVAVDLEAGHHFHPDTYVGARYKFNRHSKYKYAFFTEIAYYGTNYNMGLSMILQ